MKLAAALVVRNERARYLEPCILHLAEFCDAIMVLDDASDDGTSEWLAAAALGIDALHVIRQPDSTFFKHEGRTRQKLLDFTLAAQPDWVLSIDGDEFVSDGARLRGLLDQDGGPPVWSLTMQEVWRARRESLETREDGGWRSHEIGVLWRSPAEVTPQWRMMDRALACRRVPMKVLQSSARPSGVQILHFGWTNPATRQARYDRYARHDGGRFHASAHLRSILFPDARVRLVARPWPAGDVFDGLRARLLDDEGLIAVPQSA